MKKISEENLEKIEKLTSIEKFVAYRNNIFNTILEGLPEEDKKQLAEAIGRESGKEVIPDIVNPVKGFVTSQWTPKTFHFGLDIATNLNAPVSSIAEGRIINVGYSKLNGNIVIIQHSNSWLSVYKHLSKIEVEHNQKVLIGQLIGFSGKEGDSNIGGPHLHIEIWVNGESLNPSLFLLY